MPESVSIPVEATFPRGKWDGGSSEGLDQTVSWTLYFGSTVSVEVHGAGRHFSSDQDTHSHTSLHDAERGWGLRVFLYQSLLLASAKDPGGHGMKPCVNVCKGLFHLSLLPRIELALHGDQRTRYTVWVEWACILQVSLVALPSQEERNAWYLSPEQEGSWKRGIYRRKRLMGALDMAECLLRQGGHIWISSRMLEWRPRMIEYVDRVKRVIKDLRMLFNGEHRMDAELGEGRMEFFVPRAHRLPQSIVQEYVSQLEVENGVDRAEGERTEEEEEEESGYMGEVRHALYNGIFSFS